MKSAKLEHWFLPPHGSWKEFWLSAMPFLVIFFLPGVISLIPEIERIPDWMKQVILGGLFASLVVLGLIGLLLGLPRWSLVYNGVFLTLVAYLILMSINILDLFSFPAKWDVSTTLVFMAVFLFFVFTLVALMVWIAGRLPLTIPLVQRIMADRTQLPWMMYGSSMVLVMLNYDEVQVSGLAVLSSVAMLAGSWAYLRAGKAHARMLALLVGTTIALLAALAANLRYSIIPLPPDIMVGGYAFSRVAVYLSLTWIMSMLMIYLPFGVRFWFGQDATLSPGKG